MSFSFLKWLHQLPLITSTSFSWTTRHLSPCTPPPLEFPKSYFPPELCCYHCHFCHHSHHCHHCCHRCCHRCHCCPHKCSPRVGIKVLVFLATAVLVVLLNINHQIIIINIRLATWKLAHCLIKSILLKISRQIWYEIHNFRASVKM